MTEQANPVPATAGIPAEDVLPRRGLSFGKILVWTTIIALLALLGWQLVQSGLTQPTQGAAPDFAFTSFDGDTYDLGNLRGQVVVVNFWASWCVPCIEEAPELEATWQAYKDDGVVVLGIDYLDSERKGLDFIAEHGITYPNGPDLRQQISDDYRITGVPETFVISPEGEITFHVAMPVTRELLAQEIERARQ